MEKNRRNQEKSKRDRLKQIKVVIDVERERIVLTVKRIIGENVIRKKQQYENVNERRYVSEARRSVYEEEREGWDFEIWKIGGFWTC